MEHHDGSDDRSPTHFPHVQHTFAVVDGSLSLWPIGVLDLGSLPGGGKRKVPV